MPENPIPLDRSGSQNKWPGITDPEVRTDLIALEGFLGISTLKEVTWESEQGEITYTGPHKMQTFTTRRVTNHLSDDEKEGLKRTMVARTFEALVGTQGEEIAKQLIAQASAPQSQEGLHAEDSVIK